MKNVKKLLITSANTAKEINPLGSEPKENDYALSCLEAYSRDWDAWKKAEDNLKEYRIANILYYNFADSIIFKDSGKTTVKQNLSIGSKAEFECNDENLTAIVI